MKSRRFLTIKMCDFYKEVSKKEKNKPTRLQTDQEFIKKKEIFEQKMQRSNAFGKCQRWKSFCCRTKNKGIKKNNI